MSILKSNQGDPPPVCVLPMHIRTLQPEWAISSIPICMTAVPLPSFEGEPKAVAIEGTIDEFTSMVWNSLNEDNKVSLFVRYIDIATGETETRIVNKNQ